MTLRHFEVFSKVCEKMNMTAAAEALFISQPAVSQVMRELSRHYGVALFTRRSHRIVLTEAGETLRELSAEILRQAGVIEETMLGLSSRARRTRINLGFGFAPPPGSSPGLMNEYMELEPEVELVPYTLELPELMRQMGDGRLDAAIAGRGAANMPDTEKIFLCGGRLVFAAAKNSRFIAACEGEEIDPAARGLTAMPLLLLAPATGVIRDITPVFRSYGLRYPIMGVFNNNDDLRRAAASDMGIAVILRSLIRPEDGVVTFTIKGADIRLDYYLYAHSNFREDKLMSSFVEFTRDYFKRLAQKGIIG